MIAGWWGAAKSQSGGTWRHKKQNEKEQEVESGRISGETQKDFIGGIKAMIEATWKLFLITSEILRKVFNSYIRERTKLKTFHGKLSWGRSLN